MKTLAVNRKSKDNHLEVGKIGEEIACRFLISKGYKIIDRNFSRSYGELDIIAKKGKNINFIEVKTISRENNNTVTQETNQIDGYRPEEKVNPNKVLRLRRIIEVYLSNSNISQETLWSFGIISVILQEKIGVARVKFISDIVI
jgi:putative endonuclease